MSTPTRAELAAIDTEILEDYRALQRIRAVLYLTPSGAAVTLHENAEASLNEALERRHALTHPAPTQGTQAPSQRTPAGAQQTGTTPATP